MNTALTILVIFGFYHGQPRALAHLTSSPAVCEATKADALEQFAKEPGISGLRAVCIPSGGIQ